MAALRADALLRGSTPAVLVEPRPPGPATRGVLLVGFQDLPPRSILLLRQAPPTRSSHLDEALALCHLAAAAARIEITPVTLRHEGAPGVSELSVEVIRGSSARASPPGWLLVEREVKGQLLVTGSDLSQLFRLASVAGETGLQGVCWRVVRTDGSCVEVKDQLGSGFW